MTTRTFIEDTILKAECPNCETVNAFPEFDTVDAFVCHECGMSIEIESTADLTTRQIAERYVEDQLAVMRKYGDAPNLTAQRKERLITDCQRLFDKIRDKR